jgi:hypothetical protein
MTDIVDLEALLANGAQRYDPVRFRFIEALSQRAAQQTANVGDILQQKVLAAAQQYQADFDKAHKDAATVLRQGCVEFPDDAAQMQALFDACDYRQLARTAARLRRRGQRAELAPLCDQLTQASGDNPNPYDIDNPAELKAIGEFRETLAKRNSQKRLNHAIQESPQNSGPLNPQRLVIRSLASMRDLSPQYLNRFISYMDTLLWLEQAGDKTSPSTKKARI